MSTFIFNLSDPWFDLVRRGKKIYEGRRYSEKCKHVKIGDEIVFQRTENTDEIFRTRVKNIHLFQTFRLAIAELGIDRTLCIKGLTLDSACDIYRTYVSDMTQLKEGVVMFEIELVKD